MSNKYESPSNAADPADQPPPRTTRHPFDRQDAISRRLRDRMIAGELKPGDRLPSRADLIKRFKTSAVTINKALGRLEREGFIESRAWEGTFVAAAPPHLFRYGLMLPDFADTADTSRYRFASTLSFVADATVGQRPRRLAVYSNIRGESEGEEDTLRLQSDLDHQCLAGMIFTERFTLENYSLARMIRRSTVPKVALLSDPYPEGVAPIRLEPYWDQAARYFASRGRRRVGFVFIDGAASAMWNQARSAMAAHGLETRLWWRIDVNTRVLSADLPALQMMMQLPIDNRPDALLICDDSLVPGITAGLAETGAANSFDVVAHANFPCVTHSCIPAARLGYDAREVLRSCVDTIDQIRAGKQPSSLVPARWEAGVSMDLVPSFLNQGPSNLDNQPR